MLFFTNSNVTWTFLIIWRTSSILNLILNSFKRKKKKNFNIFASRKRKATQIKQYVSQYVFPCNQKQMKVPSLVTLKGNSFKRQDKAYIYKVTKCTALQMHLKVASHLKDVLNNSIRGTKQVNTRDAAHLRLHSAWRQVLLPQTWNHHRVPRARGSHIHVTQYRGGTWKKQDTYLNIKVWCFIMGGERPQVGIKQSALLDY